MTGLTAGTLYSFEVRAYDAAGNRSAAWSTAATATTTAPDATPPVWTATLTPGTPDATSVVVTASALATDANAITYERTLDMTAATPTWAAIVPAGLDFTLTGLSAATTYANCGLRAKDTSGNVTALAIPSFRTAAADSTAPSPGSMTASEVTTGGFTLTVSGAADDPGGAGLHATPYAFTTDGGATWTNYRASPAYVISGLTAETGYTCNWRVRDALDNVGTGTAQTVTTLADGQAPPAVAATWIGFRETAADATSYTFNIPSGTSGVGTIVGVATRKVPPSANVAVTIGGVSATILAQATNSGTTVALAYAPISPTAGTNVVVTTSATVLRCGVGAWAVDGTASLLAARTTAGGGVVGTRSGSSVLAVSGGVDNSALGLSGVTVRSQTTSTAGEEASRAYGDASGTGAPASVSVNAVAATVVVSLA